MPNYDNLRLEKGLYSTSGGFSKALEELDPSENYVGTNLEGLDAFERQLKRFDIRVGGHGSDVVEKFFKTSDSATLFPEYVARAVRQGMDSADVLSQIVATTTQINCPDYRAITSDMKEDETELKRVTQGSFIPQTVISPSNELVTLRKRGRMVVASYETIRFQRLDLFTVMLKQIGAQIASSQLEDAIDALMDKTDKIHTKDAGKLSYDDLVALWNSMGQYNMTTMITKGDNMPTLLGFSEFKDAAAGLNFHATGKLVTPLGAQLIKSKKMDESCIIGLDKDCALEKVEAGGIVTDYDKLIDRQLERASITCTTGFSKIFTGATKILTTQAKN
ncbi:MAG: phage major capsid protein [Acutalibacteraceae bacterium]|jgi:hypothetical protein